MSAIIPDPYPRIPHDAVPYQLWLDTRDKLRGRYQAALEVVTAGKEVAAQKHYQAMLKAVDDMDKEMAFGRGSERYHIVRT